MRFILYITLIMVSVKSQAQYLFSSNTVVESCNDLDSCLSINNSSYLYYDETKNEFFLKVDFSNFRSKTVADNWLNKERDTILYFRMLFPKENFPVLGMEERQSFKVNGRIFYNNKWKDLPVEITMFSSQNSPANTTSPGTNSASFEQYKINFTLPFVPSEFKSYSEIYYNSQTVRINVTQGRINLLKPGMENLLSEVYYQNR